MSGGRGENFISPAGEGSARSIDIMLAPRFSAANALTGANAARGGIAYGIVGTSSNWGLGGTDSGTLVRYKGSAVWQVRGGCIGHEIRVPLVTTRPTAITMWRDGLWVSEVVLAWPTNAVGADNGFIWGPQGNVGNLRPSVAQCCALMNDLAGGLNFVMRGPTGTQTTAIAGLTLTEFNKFRVEMKPATRDADATIQVFVNDAGAPAISKTSSDANFPPVGAAADSMYAQAIGTSSATDYVNIKEWRVWSGPNTTIGM